MQVDCFRLGNFHPCLCVLVCQPGRGKMVSNPGWSNMFSIRFGAGGRRPWRRGNKLAGRDRLLA
eukprot:10380179-Prorocentrum_lima.AAC.1